ncbi:hypothetical protein CISIN_1g033872mg [Citrus sinensis]|uniref:Uncharacterized protein n=1 Tax=Citrus sinensis TaxID=2711 RepID=A0A067D5L8_CITSI|nr:hypothetical protein CISIN_1g033872mg [Citrus sinensis]
MAPLNHTEQANTAIQATRHTTHLHCSSLTLSIRVLSIRKNGPNQQRLYCIARRFGDDGLHSLRSGNFAVAGSRSRIWVFSAGFRFGRWILFGSLSHGSFEALDYYHYYYL